MAEAEAKTVLTEDGKDIKDVADELQAAANKAREEAPPKEGVGVLRTQTKDKRAREFHPSDIPYPEGIHGEEFEFYGPSGFAAYVPEGTPISAFSTEQGFVIDPEKVRVLHFQKPGRNLPKKRLYTVKAIHKDGRLVQLPFEQQIQNNAGGDPQDAIGLHRYERKGIHVLIDWNTLMPVYCAAWGCFAQATQTGAFTGFCTQRHAMHTMPNNYKDAGEITKGVFGEGATTSRTWSV